MFTLRWVICAQDLTKTGNRGKPVAQIIKFPKMAPIELVRLLHDKIGGKISFRGGRFAIVKIKK